MLDEAEVLDDAVETIGEEFKFQQDGAPAHTARITLDYLQTKCDTIINCPANSPDLNDIE